eukprot:SAG31_NODE_6935_length_1844_cov_1.910029_1_plen_107_part_10
MQPAPLLVVELCTGRAQLMMKPSSPSTAEFSRECGSPAASAAPTPTARAGRPAAEAGLKILSGAPSGAITFPAQVASSLAAAVSPPDALAGSSTTGRPRSTQSTARC